MVTSVPGSPTTSHSLLPQGCGFFKRSISPMRNMRNGLPGRAVGQDGVDLATHLVGCFPGGLVEVAARRGVEYLPGTGEDGSLARSVHSVPDGQIEASALSADPGDQQRHLRTGLPHCKELFRVSGSYHKADVVLPVPLLCLLSHDLVEPVWPMS